MVEQREDQQELAKESTKMTEEDKAVQRFLIEAQQLPARNRKEKRRKRVLVDRAARKLAKVMDETNKNRVVLQHDRQSDAMGPAHSASV